MGYSELDTAAREIRLLRLLPGKAEETISVDLRVTSLDEQHEDFEALSYVWGKPKEGPRIDFCGEGLVPVTDNLLGALRGLRLEDQPRVLWVDALCINQASISERSQQVRLMRDIYSRARRTVVWLGESLFSCEVVETIDLFANDRDMHWTPENMTWKDAVAIVLIYLSPWWTRVWTIQEAVLARAVVYLCDGQEIPAENWAKLIESFHLHIARGCCPMTDLGHPQLFTAPHRKLQDCFGRFRRLWDARRSLASDLAGGGAAGQGRLAGIRDLAAVASMFRFRNATDPRDKIYGLLGLFPDMPMDWVDYGLTVEETYEKAARETVRHRGGLHILSYAFWIMTDAERDHILGQGFEQSTTLPSWVPDWSWSSNDGDDNQNSFLAGTQEGIVFLTEFWTEMMKKFKAHGGNHVAHVDHNDPPGSLGVSGLVLDTVRKVCEPQYRGMKQPFHSWRAASGVEHEPGAAYPGGGTRSDAYWRTLCLNTSAATDEAGPRRADGSPGGVDRHLYDEWWFGMLLDRHGVQDHRRDGDDDPPSADPEEPTAAWVRAQQKRHIENCCDHRVFFVSERGYFGLGPPAAAVGDRICVLAGGPAAYILRPAAGRGTVSLPGHGDVPAFTLVGDAYVQGLMDGEAMIAVDEGTARLERWALV